MSPAPHVELKGTGPEVLAYLQGLQVGERVIETGCRHQHEVWSPIDTVEVCVKCGDRRPCPPLIE